ncbi:MAG: sugar ABC transporter permease [Caldilineaceae bacterium]|nr:sugar ABC transporter permease [Caldilineaceae bacterium]
MSESQKARHAIQPAAAPAFSTELRVWGQQLAADYGDVLPLVVGLVVIAVIFQSQNQNFLTARNFVNLIVQMAGICTIAYGVVFVLLLGELDLSVGYVSAVAAVSMALLLRDPTGWPWYAAITLVLLIAAGIGLLHGLIITTFQIPSVIVTLASLLAWNGVVLLIIGGSGTILIQDPVVIGIANYFLPPVWGWLLAALIVTAAAVRYLQRKRVWARRNISGASLLMLLMQLGLWAAVIGGVVYIANRDRGVPMVGVVLLLLLALLSSLANHTAFGRYVYAVGGNQNAAYRAGIPVGRIRVVVFMISSIMAGLGGIILAARLRSVDTAAGSGNLLFNSIAAAVIGGTSLFGGRGRVSSASLGALMIAGMENGMGLLGLSPGLKFLITGLVLLVAVLADAATRRRRLGQG